MATQETQQIDSIISSRRALMLGGSALAALVLSGTDAKAQASYSDNDILNFALNLEYLEAEFYTLATTGKTLTQYGGIGTGAGSTSAGSATITTKGNNNYTSCLVPFTIPYVQAYGLEIAAQERAHVNFLRTVLTTNAVAEPNIDLFNSFNHLAAALPLGLTTFDPFASDVNFLIGSYIFEDVGVSAYHGGAGLLTSAVTLGAAAQIHATEAYHASAVRSTLFELDQAATALGPAGTLQTVTQDISALRAQLSGTSGATSDDVGLSIDTTTLNGTGGPYSGVTYVSADSNSIGFARTPAQVLSIVYANSASGTASGGFYPNGLNGSNTMFTTV